MSVMLRHDIQTHNGALPSLLWLPHGATGQVPGIVVFQEIYGLSDYVRARCADLAELGYAVLAPQLFARLDPPVSAVQEDGADPQAALGQALELAESRGELLPDVDCEHAARILIAVTDGLQVQWLAGTGCPDMAEDFAVLVDALRRTWGR